jgi:hypothetical protein
MLCSSHCTLSSPSVNVANITFNRWLTNAGLGSAKVTYAISAAQIIAANFSNVSELLQHCVPSYADQHSTTMRTSSAL